MNIDNSDDVLVAFAKRLILECIDAVNRGDYSVVRELSVVGVQSDNVVSRYIQVLDGARPLRAVSVSEGGPIERGRNGPRWAPWVFHDTVTLVLDLESRHGRLKKEIFVWVYHLEEGLAGQLASRLVD